MIQKELITKKRVALIKARLPSNLLVLATVFFGD